MIRVHPVHHVFGLLTGLCLYALPSAQGELVQWPAEDGGNDHWYEAVHAPEGISWTDAQAAAEGSGMYLATITSAEENAFVFSLIADRPELWIHPNAYHGPWIGGWQDPDDPDYWEPGGGWKWVSGEAWGFTAWAPGEPSDSGGEDRLQYFGYSIAPTWNDTIGDHPSFHIRGYVVELSADCPADFDGNGEVNTADLLYLLGAWGTPDGDVDFDGDTDTADLLALLGAWGECP
jgi:hypothetical protein